jgi:predicted RecB family nuclease
MVTKKPVQHLIKPSDASSWISCIRRVWLDKHQATEFEIDDFSQLLFDIGLEHEAAVLAKLQNEHDVHKANSVEHTLALMAQGVTIIYQARLLNEQEGLIGFPDFLVRHESGHYQPADAKLAQSEHKKGIQIQLGLYRRLLANQLPAIVFLGDGRTAVLGDEIDPLVDDFILSMKELLHMSQQPDVRYSHSKCRICPYYTHCRPDFDGKGDLSLLYGIHGNAAMHLAEAGIDTITQLANNDGETIPDVPYLKGPKRKHRAVLQAKSFLTGEIFQLNRVKLPEGAWIHFDIEDNPLTPTLTRHVYLWGFLAPPYTKDNFEYVWTDDETQDYEGWLGFLKKMKDYHAQFGSLILAHYSNHERATIKKYAERYDMQDNATVLWLLGNDSPLFDMQKAVLDNLVLPLQGYGLKDICKHPYLVNFQWENEESGSQWSVVQFSRFLAETNPQEKEKLKTDILGYNRDDVIATRRLEEWLRKNFS